MTKTLAAAVFAVLLLCLSACGGSSDSDSSAPKSSSSAKADKDDATAAKSISSSIMASQTSQDGASQLLAMDQKDADCIGKGLVDKIGTDQLQKYDLLTKSMKTKDNVASVKMSATDADSATDVLFGCTDVESMMKTAMGKSGSVPKQIRGCVNKVLTEDNLRPMFGKIFQGKQAAAQKELTTPLLACAKNANAG